MAATQTRTAGHNAPGRVAGRHFLQIPGPTNVPDRILRAMDAPTMDHRSPAFGRLGLACLEGMKTIFKTEKGRVFIYPASGTGAWEAALVNTLSAGDTVLMVQTGHFALLWKKLAERLGLVPRFIDTDWRVGADAAAAEIEATLAEDKARTIKAVCVVHNETSTGCTTDVAAIRRAIDAAGHPALLMVDTISSLASIDYRHDEWGVDVTVGGSQKGLMLPPGLSFNAVSDKAMTASEHAGLPRSFWSWDEHAGPNATGYFPYTPATNLLYGLCRTPHNYSSSLTAVMMPEGHSADGLRAKIRDAFDMSLGNGLSRLADRVFRIGHLGDFNDLTLMGTLAGIEMGLGLAGVPHKKGGVSAAMEYLAATARA